jgi:hypothetical protein
MKPVASGERGTATWLTGAVGLLVLTVAVVMMVMAAPGRPGSHHAATQAATQAAAGPGRQVTLRTDSTMVRACRTGPSAVSAWAQAYTPSMITQSWSASSSDTSVRPPLANPAVS